MNASEVREKFLTFFESKQHKIVPSAPMVVKNDPTLMFTNAGMNQFKDIFLGNSPAKYSRIADTQKCLRVSGKHNDLEEVGQDTYHHTMFEMLGNWSFGDYFKKEAIAWAWELLTGVYKINPENLYVTIFEGDEKEQISRDNDAYNFWKEIIAEDRILLGSKKDNFWEMGDTGPCGPCSEIHVDIRNHEEKKKISGVSLVNQGHPQVIEIWNLVFIEYNRKADGTLELLPSKHVDTGMGFERLCMVLQGVQSNYDTDVFQPIINQIGNIAGIKYGADPKADVAMRVIADHLRAIAFSIADGQLPANNKAGYVIRRILRRAVRYGYTFLNMKSPFICNLVPMLATQLQQAFPELKAQQDLIVKVIQEEENSFLRTLETGISKFENYCATHDKIIEGDFAFELFDTYGFPKDLTCLIAREKGIDVDLEGFDRCMEEQKNRSRNAAAVDKEDWMVLVDEIKDSVFVGYEKSEAETRVLKYRKVMTKEKSSYQIVLEQTPFYAESGGQVGDKGVLIFGDETIHVLDTKKENDLFIHLIEKLPQKIEGTVIAKIDVEKRLRTRRNHTATHLLHKALKEVLGAHVEQKGSLVNDERLRFDFAHFSAMTEEEKNRVEEIILKNILENNEVLTEVDSLEEARSKGAVALFGEKYGEQVRVVTIGNGYSKELCGGTHVSQTGQIGSFYFVEETAIAAGIRRIEAVTGDMAYKYIQGTFVQPLKQIKNSIKKPFQELPDFVASIIDQNAKQAKELEAYESAKALAAADELLTKLKPEGDYNILFEKTNLNSNQVKDIAFKLRTDERNLFVLLGNISEEKVTLSLILSDAAVKNKGLNASQIIRELAKEIQGGGGGQPFFATAGGKNPLGLDHAFAKGLAIVKS